MKKVCLQFTRQRIEFLIAVNEDMAKHKALTTVRTTLINTRKANKKKLTPILYSPKFQMTPKILKK